MKKSIILIAILSALVIGLMIYAFSQTGTPFKTRSIKLDNQRVTNIKMLKNSIDSYYSQNKHLPQTLNDLFTTTYFQVSYKQDPETNQEFEYKITSATGYNICATFTTSTQDQQNPNNYNTIYYDAQYSHPQGYYCFNINVSSLVYYPTPSPVTKPSGINWSSPVQVADPKISKITTDATDIKNSNYPRGLFSDDFEWGLINYKIRPVKVIVTFKEPVKIASITNQFSYCAELNCYEWSAEGFTSDAKSESIVDLTSQAIAKGNDFIESTQDVSSDKTFTTVTITAKHLTEDQYVYWKKLKFSYKDT